jgi:hypothetical protein
MFQNLRPPLCHRATAAAASSETGLPSGCGIAAGLRAAPSLPNGRSPRTGLAYRAAAQFRAVGAGNSSFKQTEGILQ